MFDHPAPRAALPCLLACALLGAHSTSASADTALSLGSSTVIANPSSGSLPTSSVISSVDLLGSDISSSSRCSTAGSCSAARRG